MFVSWTFLWLPLAVCVPTSVGSLNFKKTTTLLQNFQRGIYCNEIYFPVVWRDIIIIIINKHYEKMVRQKDFQAVLLNDLFQCYMSRPFTCCNNVLSLILSYFICTLFCFLTIQFVIFHLTFFSFFCFLSCGRHSEWIEVEKILKNHSRNACVLHLIRNIFRYSFWKLEF